MSSANSTVLITSMCLLIAILMPFATDAYTPSLPAIANYFHISANATQLTISLFLLGATVSQLFYGPLSDRYGRRLPILIGISLCFIGSILCAIASSAKWLILFRVLQGIGAGTSNVMFRAVMRDSFTGVRMAKIASYTGMIYTCMLAGAPIFGGYVEILFGWRANFISVAVLCMAILPMLFFKLPETNLSLNPLATHPPIFIKNYLILLKDKNFMGYSLCSSLAFSGMIAYYTISPFLVQNILGWLPNQYGWLSIGLALGLFLGQYTNSRLVEKIGYKNMLIYGLYLMAFSGILLTLFTLNGYISVFVIVFTTLFFTIGCGLVFSNAMVGAFHYFPHIAGTAGALYGTIQVFNGFCVSFILTRLPQQNIHLLGLSYLTIGLVSYIIFKALLKKQIKTIVL